MYSTKGTSFRWVVEINNQSYYFYKNRCQFSPPDRRLATIKVPLAHDLNCIITLLLYFVTALYPPS
jgi:hypothetical protein